MLWKAYSMRLDAQNGEKGQQEADKIGLRCVRSELFVFFLDYLEEFFFGPGLQEPLAKVGTLE